MAVFTGSYSKWLYSQQLTWEKNSYKFTIVEKIKFEELFIGNFIPEYEPRFLLRPVSIKEER